MSAARARAARLRGLLGEAEVAAWGREPARLTALGRRVRAELAELLAAPPPRPLAAELRGALERHLVALGAARAAARGGAGALGALGAYRPDLQPMPPWPLPPQPAASRPAWA